MNKIFEIIFVVALICCFALLVYIAFNLNTEGAKCVKDPLVYGAKNIAKANNAEFIGYGYITKPNSGRIVFSPNGSYVEKPDSNIAFINLGN